MKCTLTILITLLASTLAFPLALPSPAKAKKDLIDIDPTVDLELLNDLCVGIAVCNPVTVSD
ncbi:hypothetical protein EG329_008810 [Mollisiaceae sp. DMI_Dod_QoI]|nr:hypothetical protein EG329_008810 [Helotiales sp. DMI_Dod_QoI]